jgi:urea transport system ATP-binding protein
LSDKILDLQAVTVSFDGFKVLDELDFSIRHGELRFLIGPNGAGKTTLLDIITGKTRPTRGQVIFDNGATQIDIRKQAEHKLVQLGIGRKFQTPSIFASLTVYQTLEAALGFHDNPLQLFKKLDSSQRDRIATILTQIGLQDKSKQLAGTLAHGEKQWLEIGMLLVQQPRLLLLDEPVAGMTRRERDKTGELIQAISGKERSVLVVEHDMQFIRQFASTVTVLHQGKLLCEGPVEEVQSDARVIEVYIGRQRERAA